MTNPGLVSVMDAQNAGAIVWWTLEGQCSLAELTTKFDELGLPSDWLPSAPSPAQSLKRAIDSVRQPKQLLAAHPSGGYAVYQQAEIDIDGDPELRVVLHAYLNEEGAFCIRKTTNEELKDKLLDAYNRECTILAAQDISHWLINVLAKKLFALSLRDRGGVYFITSSAVERYSSLVSVLSSLQASYKLYQIPAMKSKDAIAAIIDAITSETNKYSETVFSHLCEEKMGKRALETQLKESTNYLNKIKIYEEVVGENLDKLRAQLTNLQACVSASILSLEPSEEEAQ
jgi:hypothetical protein